MSFSVEEQTELSNSYFVSLSLSTFEMFDENTVKDIILESPSKT